LKGVTDLTDQGWDIGVSEREVLGPKKVQGVDQQGVKLIGTEKKKKGESPPTKREVFPLLVAKTETSRHAQGKITKRGKKKRL